MSALIQTFNSGGVLTFDSTDYLARIVGTLFIGQDVGSIGVASFASGTPFALFFPNDTGTRSSSAVYAHSFPDANGFSWSWPDDGGIVSRRLTGYFIYGVK